MVLTGTIKNYNIERGFGFISTSNFGDVFFHIKDFQKGEQPIPGEFKHEVRQFQKPYDNQQAEQISLMV